MEDGQQTEKKEPETDHCVGTTRSQNMPSALGPTEPLWNSKLRHEDSSEAGLRHVFLCKVMALRITFCNDDAALCCSLRLRITCCKCRYLELSRIMSCV